MDYLPPLLALAEGRRPRARRQPVYRPKENKLHVQIVSLLSSHCLPDWRWRHISGKAKDAREGAIWRAMGVKAGWPDFQIVSPRGIVHFIELKRAGETLSGPQLHFKEWCDDNGINHAVAYTIDEALEALDNWGCLRIRIPKRSAR